MVQWELQFQRLNKSLSDPRRPNESAQDYQVRQVVTAQALKRHQLEKPTGPTPQGAGTSGNPPKPKPAQSGGGFLDGLYGYITNALDGR